MIDFDQTVTWRTLEDHLATLNRPRQQAILQTVIDHADRGAKASHCQCQSFHSYLSSCRRQSGGAGGHL